MIEKLKHRYALSEDGAKNMIIAFIAVTVSNVVLMLPIGLLYKLSSYLLEGRVPDDKFGFFVAGIIVVFALVALTTLFH